jgi:Ca2+-binding RTX toxin-like protein
MSSQATAGRETLVNSFTTGNQQNQSVSALTDGGWIVTWESNGQLGNNYGAYQQRYAADGSKVGTETQADSYVNPHQYYQHSSVVGQVDGGWTVTWETGLLESSNLRSIYQQHYDAHGNKVGGETFIDTYTLGYLLEGTLSVTALADGGSVISWQSYDADSYGIYQQRVAANGTPVGTAAIVETGTTGSQYSPTLAGLNDGGWVVTWSSANAGGNNSDVYQQRYDSDGNKDGSEIQVSTYSTVGSRNTSAVASLADGGWVVTWTSLHYVAASGGTLQQDYDVYQQRYSADGDKVASGDRVNTTVAGSQDFSTVAGLADGGWVVLWSSYNATNGGWDVYQQRYGVGGGKIGAEVHEASSETLVNTFTTGSQILPEVSALSDGGWIVTWMSQGQDNTDGGYGIYQRHFAPDILGTSRSEKLVGTAWDEYLLGYAGNDTLDGKAGADIMVGGDGNDTYLVDNSRDTVQEKSGDGTDLVKASVSYTLAVNVENLTLTGSKDIGGTGNSLANTIAGNSGDNILKGLGGNDNLTDSTGNDTLDGGSGADTMAGGKGNDTYVVDNIHDTVQEKSGEGTDLVRSSIYYRLGANVEKLTLIGSGSIDGTGNSLANMITGNSRDNVLNGGGGNDTLSSGGGNDVLIGGSGRDILAGGAGADHFAFLATSDSSSKAAARDVIKDFVHGMDRIDLHAIDASTVTGGDQAFVLDHKGSAGIAVARGHISWYQEDHSGTANDITVLRLNVDNDTTTEMTIELHGLVSLTKGDFML